MFPLGNRSMITPIEGLAQSQAMILGVFDQNVGLCCSCFLVAMGDRGYFVESSNEAR